MSSAPARRARAAGLVPILLIASCAVVALQVADYSNKAQPSSQRSAAASAPAKFHDSNDAPTTSTSTPAPTTSTTTTTTTAPPTPVTQPPPAPPTTTTTTAPPAPPPAQTPAVQPSPTGDVPAEGQATAWGCVAALAYLTVYAYPGFTLECPGGADGRQAMTCSNEPDVCPGQNVIAIADACPAAYMNEASNSWVLMGQSNAPIDPYGTC
jgi:cytoskeletal protein RodZ